MDGACETPYDNCVSASYLCLDEMSFRPYLKKKCARYPSGLMRCAITRVKISYPQNHNLAGWFTTCVTAEKIKTYLKRKKEKIEETQFRKSR